jgi:hypothetical protein
MRNALTRAMGSMTVALCVCSVAMAQTVPSRPNQAGASPWKFYAAGRAVGDGGPAPKRDLTGTWAGPGSGAGPSQFAEDEEPREAPSLTPRGKQLMSLNKPLRPFGPAGSNDPFVRYCDPFGFPRNMNSEIRGVSFATMPNRVMVLVQFMDVWREIWTDGRALPTNVGGTGKDSLNPRYNGYSVGHWEDDYTFVVDTTGLDDRTWLTAAGYPHTVNAHVQERYTRVSHNDLKLTMTVDDPALYSRPFSLGSVQFRWIPNQQIDEWLCVPSEVQEYLRTMGDPAGSDPSAEKGSR